MTWDLYADELAKNNQAMGTAQAGVAPGAFEGFGKGTGMLAMRELAKFPKAVSMGLSVLPYAVDLARGTTNLTDKWFKTHDDVFGSAVDYWTPRPNEVGLAGEVVGPLIGTLSTAVLNPLATVAATQMNATTEVGMKPGVTTGQAVGVGAVQGVGFGLGLKAPLWGSNVWNRSLIGGGVNLAQGVVTRGISQAILGDNPAAADYPAFGGKEMLLDTAIGAAMGALFHMVPSARKEGDAAYKALKDKVTEKVDAWAERVKPSDLDALLVARQAEHLEGQTMPGRPTSPRAVTDNVDRVVKAIEQLNTTGRVDVEVPPTVAKPPNVEQFAARAAQEIAPDTALAPVVEKLQRAYIEQGPEVGQAELAKAIEAGKADGTIPPEIATPQMAEALHSELLRNTEQFAAEQQAAQPPFVPDPVRQAQAEAIMRAMREEAGRIATEEGLPKTPEVVEPVHDVIRRDFEAAGRSADEAGKAALLISEWFKKAAQDIQATTGRQVDPDALFARYYAGTKRFGASPDAALKQDAAAGKTYPARDIKSYKPQDGKDSKGRRLLMNEHVALGRPVPTGSKGEKGERLTFTIFDRSQGRGTPVGFVIAEVDANGKFAALRNIEIRDDIRSLGLGEKTVATMLAHNGPGFPMEIVDIQHAGGRGVGSKDDALPFWKKVGTRLVNYSRNPNVQMDGILSLEDYLGARNGQGPAAGRGRGPQGAGEAHTRGTEGPGRPSAADRAELSRLLGEGKLYQGPSLWYHSALARAIDAVDAKAQPVKGWKDWLKGQVAKGGIKADEIKWTGLEEWLDLQQGKVTKEALQSFMRDGGVRVEEVELGATKWNAAAAERMVNLESKINKTPEEDAELLQLYADRDNFTIERETTGTRFGTFQLPGAKEGSYRELALVMPAKTKPPTTYSVAPAKHGNGFAVFNADGDVISGGILTKSEADALAATWNKDRRALPDHAANYEVPSAHSMGDAADTNRLAHIRFNERTDADGKRVLFIEEIQSDWAQQGRDKGFAGELPPGWTIEKVENGPLRFGSKDYFVLRQPDGSEAAVNVTRESLIANANARQAMTVPPGPFVGKTDAWVGLALKRMIRYAAENGFDRIAWTNGEQQAARYNLAQVVHRIDVVGRTDARTGEETRAVFIHAKDGTAVTLGVDNAGKVDNAKPTEYQGKALQDIVGKAMAEKIMANRTQTIEGDGLKIGGEGMKGFYDQIIPSVAKDVMKKLGGGKVELIDVVRGPTIGSDEGDISVHQARDGTWFVQDNSNGNTLSTHYTREDAVATAEARGGMMQQQGITITPEMRAKAMESQALFQKPEGASPERGFLSIDPNRKMTIGFLEAADASTAVHEPAHFFLEVMDDLAKTEPAMQGRMDVLLKDWGLTKEQWDGMNLEERRPFHKQFAVGFEAYLMSNKAPNERLRDVFRSFRDWLLAVYKSATSLNIKVSQEVRALWDQMLNSEASDPSTTPAATAAATASPPPPRGGAESQPPATVDPFADLVRTETPAPWVPRTIEDQDVRQILRDMAEQEAGWAQVGGKHMGGETGIPRFSTWIPKAEWWMTRPDKKMNADDYYAAVAKALVGDKLKPAEKRAVDFLITMANQRLEAHQKFSAEEWNGIAQDLQKADLEPTTQNVVDTDAVAKAAAIDEGQVERLSQQYADDDVGFMAEIRRLIDQHENPPKLDLPTLVQDSVEWATMKPEVEAAGLPPTPKNMLDVDAVAIALQIDEARVQALAKEHAQHDRLFMAEIRRMIDEYKNSETVPGGEGNQAAQGEGAAQADAGAGPSERPAQESVGGQRAAGETPDPLAREAARFAVEHPDLTMEVEMADGSITKMTAADYLADAHAEAQRARDDVKLIDAAAQCLLGA